MKADILVLKSEYNVSWDFFNVQLLAEQMKSGWMEALQTLFFSNRPADLHPGIAGIQSRLTYSFLMKLVDHSQRLRFANNWVGEGLYVL